MNSESDLAMWTVYDHPLDWPEVYVARLWRVTREGPVATESFVASQLLDTVRESMLQMGLYCLPRAEGDDPTIIETWL